MSRRQTFSSVSENFSFCCDVTAGAEAKKGRKEVAPSPWGEGGVEGGERGREKSSSVLVKVQVHQQELKDAELRHHDGGKEGRKTSGGC